MQYRLLYDDIAMYVASLFRQHTVQGLFYHNLEHTTRVVQSSDEIASHYPLSAEEQFILKAAAWFHDTGHLFGDMRVHEENGCKLMKQYLIPLQIPCDVIDKIAGCIMATRFPARPQNLLEEIICDADTYHFGTTYFKVTDELVRKELEIRLHYQFTTWYNDALKLLQIHNFFTSYCSQSLAHGKQLNIEYVLQKIAMCNCEQ